MGKIFSKKSARRTCKHCELAVVRRSQKFRPRDGQNLISWRWSLPLPTNPVWRGSMHAISGYRGNRPTNTHTHTNRQDRLQYTVPQLARGVTRAFSECKPRQSNCDPNPNPSLTQRELDHHQNVDCVRTS